ncbi:hypothetical protein FPV67DRAFT_231969 [Lyophyllum atratum]|nr:hypothetical protein FPV67DRAFT_231969 [Lyophyllum atratum]
MLWVLIPLSNSSVTCTCLLASYLNPHRGNTVLNGKSKIFTGHIPFFEHFNNYVVISTINPSKCWKPDAADRPSIGQVRYSRRTTDRTWAGYARGGPDWLRCPSQEAGTPHRDEKRTNKEMYTTPRRLKPEPSSQHEYQN